jgi:hypothetical protein
MDMGPSVGLRGGETDLRHNKAEDEDEDEGRDHDLRPPGARSKGAAISWHR